MENNIKEIIEELEILKSRVAFLERHIEKDWYTQTLIDLKITLTEEREYILLVDELIDNIDNGISKYTYQDKAKSITNKLKISHSAETLLDSLADCNENYKKLYNKLYK